MLGASQQYLFIVAKLREDCQQDNARGVPLSYNENVISLQSGVSFTERSVPHECASLQTKLCGGAASNAKKVAGWPGMDHLMRMDRGGMMSTSEKVDSTWAPLRVGIFRALWIAVLVSNIGTLMQSVGCPVAVGQPAARLTPGRAGPDG